MIEKTKTLHDFVNNLKTELRVTNLQLSKIAGIDSKIILDIDEKKQDLESLRLENYRKLIFLKDWDRNYLYEPFIKKSHAKSLIEEFADFIKNLMRQKQLTLQQIADLEEELTVNFAAQISDGQIHPDLVTVGFIKKLLILKGEWSKKKIDNHYFRPITETIFTPYEVKRFAELVYNLRETVLQISQEDFGLQIGVSGSNISRWEKGRTNPDIIKVEHFRALASLKGWTVEHIMNYIYGSNSRHQESYESISSKAKNLPTLLRIRLAQELLRLGEKDLIYSSLDEFSKLLNNYIKNKNLSLEEAANKLKINPVSRLQAILNQEELPTNMEILKISSQADFVSESGDRYSHEDLKQMIYDRLSSETPKD